jgi:hypothetical protein
MSDVAYGIPEWVEIGRTKISCGPVLIDSDPGRDGALAGGDSSVPSSVPDAPNDDPCAGLTMRLSQASAIRDANARSFGRFGPYSPVLSDLTDAERNYLGNPTGSVGSNSSFSPIDNVNLTLAVTDAAAANWAYHAGRIPTQTTVSGPYGMTGYQNVVGRANVVAGASLGLGIAGLTLGSLATVDSLSNGDRAGGYSNLAGTALNGLSLVPGPIGVIAGTSSAAVNASIALLQAGVDVRAHVDTVAGAKAAIGTMQLADRQINTLTAEKLAKGCP